MLFWSVSRFSFYPACSWYLSFLFHIPCLLRPLYFTRLLMRAFLECDLVCNDVRMLFFLMDGHSISTLFSNFLPDECQIWLKVWQTFKIFLPGDKHVDLTARDQTGLPYSPAGEYDWQILLIVTPRRTQLGNVNCSIICGSVLKMTAGRHYGTASSSSAHAAVEHVSPCSCHGIKFLWVNVHVCYWAL